MGSDIPRRNRVDQWTDAERAIDVAMQAVEDMPADVRLTDAVVLLGAARASVADFVDGVERRDPYAVARAEGRSEGLEAAAAEMCLGCERGWPISYDGMHSDNGEMSECDAGLVRQLIAREARLAAGPKGGE